MEGLEPNAQSALSWSVVMHLKLERLTALKRIDHYRANDAYTAYTEI